MGATIEEQVTILDGLVAKCDKAIKGADEVIVFENEQRSALIEDRARLDALRELAKSSVPAPAADTKLVAEVGFVIAVDRVVEKVRDAYDQKLDRDNARIEDRLREQREWKEQHPGKTD